MIFLEVKWPLYFLCDFNSKNYHSFRLGSMFTAQDFWFYTKKSETSRKNVALFIITYTNVVLFIFVYNFHICKWSKNFASFIGFSKCEIKHALSTLLLIYEVLFNWWEWGVKIRHENTNHNSVCLTSIKIQRRNT